MSKLFCSVDGCGRRVTARGWCGMHYHRWQRYGDTSIVLGSDKTPGTTPEERFWVKVEKLENGCWEWRGHVNSLHGYGIRLFYGKTTRSHRLAWFLTYGRWPTRMLLHACDNKICVNPAHLREGTQKENIQDAMNRNRNPKGESHGMAELTSEQVLEIRGKYKPYVYSTYKLAEEYGISRTHVQRIIERRSWKHI